MADSTQFSVVLICKNEAHIIRKVLKSVVHLSDDVVIYDSGSTDNTIDIISEFSVRIEQGPWLGFGKTKRHVVSLAKYDWVLNIDADEVLDKKLQTALLSTTFQSGTVYKVKRKNFLGRKELKWGEWGRDKYFRVFNRSETNWDEAEVHESLVIPKGFVIRTLPGAICHYTMEDLAEYNDKMYSYAIMNAEKYYRQGKKATWLKRYLSPPFAFIKNYIFLLGFLDGWYGFVSARMTSFYTFLKYSRLYELGQEQESRK